ncbi:hypothetical protein [Rhodopseudomonas palustris]|uniref:hypothetical protein n=1 Tax=Rhodopseudomonas palustris TaxID=1076 RepID=UPI001057C3E0|nr:hypothetical protein [Rhodopseudomonas palustris]
MLNPSIDGLIGRLGWIVKPQRDPGGFVAQFGKRAGLADADTLVSLEGFTLGEHWPFKEAPDVQAGCADH